MRELAISLLGPWQTTLGGQPISFKYDKVRALLAYLAVESQQPHPREKLLALLWLDLPEAAARNNLRQTFLTLREALGDHTATIPYFFANRATIQFNPASPHSLDVAIFSNLILACQQHPHTHLDRCHACARRLEQAVALYRGPFLADFSLGDSIVFEEWTTVKREWLHRQATAALATLARYYESRGHYQRAQQAVWRQLELDPWREEAHRQLMRLHLLRGERAAALAQYEKCRQVLATELGVEPEAETRLLYTQVRDQSEELPIPSTQLALPATRPHSLPPQVTPFIGRENELATISGQLNDATTRLLCLIGPGGVGKTRLALQAAAEHLDTFADGVYFAPLTALPSAAPLARTLATAIGLELGAADPRDTLINALRPKECLLLLDNFEHLLPTPAATELLTDILRQAPDVTLLVTSRERLNLQGEWLLNVTGMPIPSAEADCAKLAESDAVQLFIQSARRVRSDFALTPENMGSITHICQLVEGLPLAIELAAAWVRLLPPAEIAQEIERGLGFLTTSLRDVPARHQSLTAVFEHSWDMLSPEEQAALRRLSLFGGGFRRAAAAEVADATLPLLAALVDKSFIRSDVTGRYTTHELLRQFAATKLESAGETAAIQHRLANFYVTLTETAEPHLTGSEQRTWLTRLAEEHNNIRAVLEWALRHAEVKTAARISGAIWRFWQLHGHIQEGRSWLARILTAEQPLPPHLHAKALKGAGVLAWYQSDYAEATNDFEQSLQIFQEIDDKEGIAQLSHNLGVLAMHQGRYDEAIALMQRSLTLQRQMGDTWAIATSLNNLGAAAGRLGNDAQAAAYYQEALDLSRQIGNHILSAMLLTNLGDVADASGDTKQARTLYLESLNLRRQLGEKTGIALSLMRLGGMALDQNDYATAYRYFGESLDLFEELGDREHLIYALESIAEAAAQEGKLNMAAQLWGTAAAIREAMGTPLPPSKAALQEPKQAAAAAQLGPDAWQQAWAIGQATQLPQAIALARATSKASVTLDKMAY